ncbi:MAG: hypothetical protein JXA93_22000 [Anaerolineae bacterium]|nr:hypothetical protein [Anaerolineae bacterium]
MISKKRFPFEASYAEIETDPEVFIDAVCATLQSSFLLLPEGPGFVSYLRFQEAYEVLKRHTKGFSVVDSGSVMAAIGRDALSFVVLRTILGFTPPELAYMASQELASEIPQGYARTFDRRVRENRDALGSISPLGRQRITAMVMVACQIVQRGAAEAAPDILHRLDKVDTRAGLASMRHSAVEGVPYAMLLYERFLGRPFASHRDAVSGLVGMVMEMAVEQELRKAGVSFRHTGRAERLEGFDQAPDFIVPDEYNPRIVIESKITEDDGTARDKVTRIQHLASLSRQHRSRGLPGFEVIACIDGRGFGVRREDMRKLLEATEGKVFTFQTLDRLVDTTALEAYKTG